MGDSLVKSLCSKENITAQEHITKMVKTFSNRLKPDLING